MLHRILFSCVFVCYFLVGNAQVAEYKHKGASNKIDTFEVTGSLIKYLVTLKVVDSSFVNIGILNSGKKDIGFDLTYTETNENGITFDYSVEEVGRDCESMTIKPAGSYVFSILLQKGLQNNIKLNLCDQRLLLQNLKERNNRYRIEKGHYPVENSEVCFFDYDQALFHSLDIINISIKSGAIPETIFVEHVQ